MRPRLAPRSVRGLALAVAAVAALATIAIGVLTGFVVHEEIERQIDHRIELETTALLEIHRNEGMDRLLAVVRERERSRPPETGYLAAVSAADRGMGYIVADAAGRRLGGSLRAQPPPPGWSEFLHFRRADGTAGIAQAMNVALPGGGVLVVAADRAIVDQMDLALLKLFVAVLGMVLLILALTVWGFGHIVHLRLAAIRDSARAIMDGDLGRRMPNEGTRSEFDQLALELNRMLDRIGGLLESLRQVSSDIAHDLRTPLTRLRGDLETAMTHPDPERARDAAAAAMAEADQALDLFAALLAIAEVEGEGLRSRFAPFDLSAAAGRIAEAYEPSLEAAGLGLELDLSDAWIVGDITLVQRAIANLLDNLIAHTPRGTTARLSVTAVGDGAQLALSDDGPGVEPDAHARIFERFVRLDPARSGPGHGLGLALVSAVARAHGGATTAQRRSPGLEVSITFPVRRDPQGAPSGRTPTG